MPAPGDEDTTGLGGRLAVRPADRGDGEALLRLLTQLHPAAPPDPGAAEEVIEAVSHDPHRTLLVATIDDDVVGTADLIVVPNMTHAGHPWAAVENVVVDEARRHRGIGRALVEEIDAITRAAGCYMVQLLSLHHRREAHAFYAALGYAPVALGFRHYLEGFGPTGDDTRSAARLAGDDLTGSRFERVDFTGAEFRSVNLTDTRFRGVRMSGVVMRGVELDGVEIQGEIGGLTVNGVEIGPLVDAELDRRDPDRSKMRPTDPAGFREAWDVIERLWDGTVERARRLDPEHLHESVGGEWSFIQTLRHLVFATDSWIRRAILGDPTPWDPLDLPWDEMPDTPGVPRDRDVRPSLDEVLALRRDRMATVRAVVEGLTVESLNGHTEPVGGPGWPGADRYPVRECLLCILHEEWEHRLYAERDLGALPVP